LWEKNPATTFCTWSPNELVPSGTFSSVVAEELEEYIIVVAVWLNSHDNCQSTFGTIAGELQELHHNCFIMKLGAHLQVTKATARTCFGVIIINVVQTPKLGRLHHCELFHLDLQSNFICRVFVLLFHII
jgi:hypothetical protein